MSWFELECRRIPMQCASRPKPCCVLQPRRRSFDCGMSLCRCQSYTANDSHRGCDGAAAANGIRSVEGSSGDVSKRRDVIIPDKRR